MNPSTYKRVARTFIVCAAIAIVCAGSFKRKMKEHEAVTEIPHPSLLVVDFDKRTFKMDGGFLTGPITIKGTNSHIHGEIRNLHIETGIGTPWIRQARGSLNITGCTFVSGWKE